MIGFCESINGDLYCKETKQKFSTNYYTYLTKSSPLIVDLISRGGGNAKQDNASGIKVIYPGKDENRSKLQAVLEGETFPGSGVMTADIVASTMAEQDLHVFAQLYPDLFDQFLKKPEQKAPVKKPVKTTASEFEAI